MKEKRVIFMMQEKEKRIQSLYTLKILSLRAKSSTLLHISVKIFFNCIVYGQYWFWSSKEWENGGINAIWLRILIGYKIQITKFSYKNWNDKPNNVNQTITNCLDKLKKISHEYL